MNTLRGLTGYVGADTQSYVFGCGDDGLIIQLSPAIGATPLTNVGARFKAGGYNRRLNRIRRIEGNGAGVYIIAVGEDSAMPYLAAGTMSANGLALGTATTLPGSVAALGAELFDITGGDGGAATEMAAVGRRVTGTSNYGMFVHTPNILAGPAVWTDVAVGVAPAPKAGASLYDLNGVVWVAADQFVMVGENGYLGHVNPGGGPAVFTDRSAQVTGALAATQDGGSLNAIASIPPAAGAINHLLAVGDHGALVRVSIGATWLLMTAAVIPAFDALGLDVALRDVYVLSGTLAVVVGDNGTAVLLQSATNLGTAAVGTITVTPLSIDFTHNLLCVKPFGTTSIFAGGDRGVNMNHDGVSQLRIPLDGWYPSAGL